MSSMRVPPYLQADPYADVTYLDVPEVATVVNAATDYPMDRMSEIFDATFAGLFTVLGEQGLRPAGPAFSLHTRMPTETVDVEIGIPVDRPLPRQVTSASGLTLAPSRLPAGRVAIVSHLGPYAALGEAWGRFMDVVAAAGHRPALPFWEVYVTEPRPDADPASMRTDLVTLVD